MSFGQLMVLCAAQRKALTTGLNVREKKSAVAAAHHVHDNLVAFTGWLRQHKAPSCMAQIEGVMVRNTVIDGGSSTNILKVDLLPVLGISMQDLGVCPILFKGAGQERLPVVGIFDKARVTVKGVTVTIAFTVVRMLSNGYPALLGQPWLELVGGQHDWTNQELTLGPKHNRKVLPLDSGSQRPSEVSYEGDLRVEPEEAVTRI